MEEDKPKTNVSLRDRSYRGSFLNPKDETILKEFYEADMSSKKKTGREKTKQQPKRETQSRERSSELKETVA